MTEEILRFKSVSPLYAQMMEQIRLDIQRGIYPVGEKIPTEHELEMRYKVSRVTVRRALQELTSAGLLERKQGKGTFVAQQKQEVRLRGVLGFHEACRRMGRIPSVGKTSFREVPAEETERNSLNLSEEARVLQIGRVLIADGIPVIYEKLLFSTAYAWLEGIDLKGSLFRALQEYGIRAEKSIYDISLRKADGREAELLNTEEGTVMLAVEQIVYDQKGRPLFMAHRLVRGEIFPLKI